MYRYTKYPTDVNIMDLHTIISTNITHIHTLTHTHTHTHTQSFEPPIGLSRLLKIKIDMNTLKDVL